MTKDGMKNETDPTVEVGSQWEDKVLDSDKVFSIVKQKSGTIAWRIDGLADDDGEVYAPRKLKSNPPLLSIESSAGDTVSFILTKEVARSLRDACDRTYQAYFGIDKTFTPKTDYSQPASFTDKAKAFAENNIIKVGVTALAVVTVLVFWGASFLS